MEDQLIQPMDWGAEDIRESYYKTWSRRIRTQDPQHCLDDPHAYMKAKLRAFLPTKAKLGEDGWKFLVALNAVPGAFSRTPAQTQLLHCFVYSDGTKDHQNTPLQFDSNGELSAEELARGTWWPCLVIAAPGGDDHWPFVCPALAWQ